MDLSKGNITIEVPKGKRLYPDKFTGKLYFANGDVQEYDLASLKRMGVLSYKETAYGFVKDDIVIRSGEQGFPEGIVNVALFV